LIFPHDTRAYEFNYGDIENLKLLEATPRNIIKKAVHKPTKNPIVIKYITIPYSHFFADDDENYQHYLKMLREVENFRQLWEHPNIVNFYGLCIHGEHALIVMEQMDLSLKQLYVVVHMRGEKFPEKVIGCIFAQIVDALLHCNSKNIIHRDVKPENILINYR
jgi:serine/threonine protein kinase